MAIKLADTLEPMTENFPAVESSNVDITLNNGTIKRLQQAYEDGDLSGSGVAIQVDTLPVANQSEVGNIYQYIGNNGTYKKGHFYECVLMHNYNGTSTSIYVWQDVGHLRFNHVVYNCTVPPVNTDYTPSDIIYYGGKTMGNFKNGHYYRAIPNATPQKHYEVALWVTPSSGYQYLCYTPFEFRIGFIVYPTGTGGESTPYQITDFDDEGITISPYGWSGDEITYVGASYSTTVLGWEELEGSGGSSIFYGTMDEWNALSTDEKKQYQFMSDSQSGGGNTFWSGFTTIDEDTHVATTTDYDFEVTLPSDGYYCATVDISTGKQKVIVFIDDGLGTYYTFKTFIAQEERILERYRFPYLPAGRVVRMRHVGINGEASGQVTLKLQRVDFTD